MADFASGVDVMGSALALLSGVSYAVFVIAGRKSSFVVLRPLVVILFVSFFSAGVFGTKAAVQGRLMLPSSLGVWMLLAVISLFCTVLALAMLTVGIRILGPTTASMLNMLEPVTSVVTGILVFHEVLTLRTALGCVLILCSTLIIVLGEKTPARVENEKEARE